MTQYCLRNSTSKFQQWNLESDLRVQIEVQQRTIQSNSLQIVLKIKTNDHSPYVSKCLRNTVHRRIDSHSICSAIHFSFTIIPIKPFDLTSHICLFMWSLMWIFSSYHFTLARCYRSILCVGSEEGRHTFSY